MLPQARVAGHPSNGGWAWRARAWLNGGVDAVQRHVVRKSFGLVERQADVAALVFYQRLFDLAPQVRPMFSGDIQSQGRKLMETLAVLVSALDRPKELESELEELGAGHAGYGVRDEHYAVARQALLEMIAEVTGPAFTPEVRAAWNALYDVVEAGMRRGARGAPAGPKNARPGS